MRSTLVACRCTSRAPMHTVTSRPSRAPAIAVATPCWPAPVSHRRPSLAEALREQRLTERVVGLVRAAVEQVLALQVQVETGTFGQPGGRSQRRWSTGPLAQPGAQVTAERPVREDHGARRGELLQRRPQQFADVAAAECAERAGAGSDVRCRHDWFTCSPSNRGAQLSGVLAAGGFLDAAADVDAPRRVREHVAHVGRGDAAGDEDVGG